MEANSICTIFPERCEDDKIARDTTRVCKFRARKLINVNERMIINTESFVNALPKLKNMLQKLAMKTKKQRDQCCNEALIEARAT